MRILYFSRSYTTHDYRFLAQIAQFHEVFFLRLEEDGGAYEKRPLPEGVQMIPCLGEIRGSCTPEGLLALMPGYLELIERLRPDLIHAGPVQSCGFMTALAEFHPFLLMSWGFDILADADSSPLLRWSTSFTIRHSDLLFCDCTEVAARARQITENERLPIIQFPWGVDLSKFFPGRSGMLRERDGWREAVVVISTRTWRVDYGTEVLLEAFRLAHERDERLRLVMVGGGPLEPAVRSFVEQHKLEAVVQLPGLRSEEELPEYFRSADTYLSCSPVDGSSISLLQAMATGLPSIVADRASNREWLKQQENGWLVQAGDANSFADALVEAARLDPASRRKMASRSCEIVSRHANFSVNLPRLLAAYEELQGLRDHTDRTQVYSGAPCEQ